MDLLLKIARCPIVQHCLSENSDHPCSRIVSSQGIVSIADFQSPEPWSGHIAQAPILFLSSNPSIGITQDTQYPRANWDDKSIVDYFENRFGGSALSSVANGIYDHLPGDQRSTKPIRYWAGVRARAAELLEISNHAVRPGYDYALTEVVHCKSRKEEGVPQALSTCSGRYLDPTLNASGARVIVVLGSRAGTAMRFRYQLDASKPLLGPLALGQRSRMLAFIPHPTSWETNKTLAKSLGAENLERLRRTLRDPT